MPGQALTYVKFALKIMVSALVFLFVSLNYKKVDFDLQLYINIAKGLLALAIFFGFLSAFIFEERGDEESGFTFSRILLLVDTVLNLAVFVALLLVKPKASTLAIASNIYMFVESLIMLVLYSYNKFPQTEPSFD